MMARTCRSKLCCVAMLGVVLGLLANSAAAQSSLAESLPPGAIAFGELSGLESVVDRLTYSEYLKNLVATEQFKQLQRSPQYRQADAGRKLLENQLGMDIGTAARNLLGHRVAAALYPHEGRMQPDAVLLVRVADANVLADMRARLEPLLEFFADRIDRSTTDDGVELLSAGDELFIAYKEAWVAATNNRDLLTGTLTLLSGNEKSSLAQDESFQLMDRQMGSEHLGRVYVNTGAISDATGGRLGLPQKLDNPLGSLLLGGILEMVAHSPYAGLTLDVEEQHFTLSAGVAGNARALGPAYSPFFSSFPESGTRPIPQTPDLIGGFSVYRDFPNWYSLREELLQAQVLPGFDKFESGLANLLPGKNFGQDVLPKIGKNITFVAARQEYDHLNGKPGVQLPGFAMIVELAQPKEGAETFQLFFQTLSSILNLQAGQQGREPWLLESETHTGVQITLGRYLEKPSGDRLPLVFNFMPASARVDDRYIVSSSVSLCRQLIDELKKPDSRKVVNKDLNVELYFMPFANILESNEEFFQAQFIQRGRTPEEARQDVATLLQLLRSLKSLDLSTTTTADGLQARLEGSWQ